MARVDIAGRTSFTSCFTSCVIDIGTSSGGAGRPLRRHVPQNGGYPDCRHHVGS
jgi:hypothetical protein